MGNRKHMKMRIVTRVIIYDSENKKILLVKNKDEDFWYLPGGGWDYEKENIIECAEREVTEETGLKVKILKLIYLREFHDTQLVSFETYWIAKPMEDTKLNDLHIDTDGSVETAKWFAQDELKNVKVFPERLQNTFWENIDTFLQNENPFIGID